MITAERLFRVLCTIFGEVACWADDCCLHSLPRCHSGNWNLKQITYCIWAYRIKRNSN